ncbi:MAG TPA: hypothetical protein VMD30_12615, partial [Tepidisphaeraceae bacterium]|nr:hypothetical protein [Tepidisphaeraceae bacterium]
RYMLGVIVTVYAIVVIVQTAMGWYKILSQGDRYTALIRRYLIVSGLRMKISTFGGDVLICLLLCFVWLLLWHAHELIMQLATTLNDVRRNVHTLPWRRS